MSLYSEMFSLLDGTQWWDAIGSSFRLFEANQQSGAGELVGGAAQLVAAALQTAGVYRQADVLNTWGTALERIAGLCYLVSIIAALLCFALFGQYKKAAYLMIGPALFYYCITVRTSTDGTHLRNGDRDISGSVQQQIRFLKTWVHSSQYGSGANVSTVFLTWDAIVSSVVQAVVAQLINTQNREDLLLRTRERVFSYILHTLPDEGAFVKLLAYGSHGQCAEAMHNQIRLHAHVDPANPRNVAPAGVEYESEYNRLRNLRVAMDPQSLTLIRSNPALQQETIPNNPRCQDIWRWTAMVAHEIARCQLDVNCFRRGAPLDNRLPWREIMQHAAQAFAGQAGAGDNRTMQQRAEDVVAAYIIRNTMMNTSLDQMLQESFSRQPFNPQQQRFILDTMQNPETYGAFMKMMYVAGAIPYCQGMLLFMLAMSFPLWAILLVMPGRASSFLIWFSLWAWVKSWDVGYAMVDIARRILWQFLAHGTNRWGEQLDWNRPQTIYNLISMNDPLATHNMYLQMTAFLTCCIPFVTAHFCLGASHLLDFVKLTVDNNANKFADNRARGARRAVASDIEQLRDERVQQAGLAGAIAAAANYGFSRIMGFFGGNNPQNNLQQNAQRAAGMVALLGGPGGAPALLTQLAAARDGQVGVPLLGGSMPPPGGDFTLQEVMRQGYNVGTLNYQMSDEYRQLNTALAVATGRLSYFNYGHGTEMLNAYVDHVNLNYFLGVGPGQGNTLNGSPRVPFGLVTGGGRGIEGSARD